MLTGSMFRLRVTTLRHWLPISHKQSHQEIEQWKLWARAYAVVTPLDDEAQTSRKLKRMLLTGRAFTMERALGRAKANLTKGAVEEALRGVPNCGLLGYNLFKWPPRHNHYDVNTPEAYNLLIQCLAKVGQFDIIWTLVDEMHSLGFVTKHTLNIITHGYVMHDKVYQALLVFTTMEKYGMDTDMESLKWLLKCLCERGHMTVAEEVFRGRDHGTQAIHRDLEMYQIMLHGWGRLPDVAKVQAIFQEMQELEFELDNICYGLYLGTLCEGGEVELGLGMLKEIKERGQKLDSYIYRMMIDGLAEKHLDLSMSLFEEMRDSGFVAGIEIYNSLVGAFCKLGRFKEAYDLLKRERVIPNSQTQSLFFQYLFHFGKRDFVYSEFQKVLKTRVTIDLNTYNFMAYAYLRGKNVRMIVAVWKHMLSNGVCPNATTYSILINGSLNANNHEKACEFFEQMVDRGMKPSWKTFSRLMFCLRRQQNQYLIVNLSKKMEQLEQT